eukprot:m.309184 g.309184  ORF g.309184 m.309184 type:complete len:357 (-) comp19637_c0_seq1:240-1310(-)
MPGVFETLCACWLYVVTRVTVAVCQVFGTSTACVRNTTTATATGTAATKTKAKTKKAKTRNAMATATKFTCGICLDEVDNALRYQLTTFRTGNGDVLRPEDNCTKNKHAFCATCISQYCKTKIEEARVAEIRCPEEGCGTRLFEKDVRELVSEKEFATYQTLLRADYSQKNAAMKDAGDDIDMLLALHELSLKICPKCGVVIQRSVGCNSMACICGFYFNFQTARSVVEQRKGYARFLRVAKKRGLSARVAEQIGGERELHLGTKVLGLMDNVSLAEAVKIAMDAKNGDEKARGVIRDARKAKKEKEERQAAKDKARAEHRAQLRKEAAAREAAMEAAPHAAHAVEATATATAGGD